MAKPILKMYDNEKVYQELFEDYIASIKIQGMAEETIRTYYYHHKYFMKFIGYDIKCKDIDVKLLNNYKMMLLDKNLSEEIVNQSNFTSQILLATTCIDNGVSLKMIDLKHIVIDMINPITLKQILGRKRFLNSEDKVNIYIRNHNNKELAGILNKDKSIYDQANFFY